MTKFEAPQLGDRVRDPITGFTGIATSIATWLHGCIRVGVSPEKAPGDKPPSDRFFDQSQLVVVKKRVHAPMVLAVTEAPPPETRRSTGGPVREGAGFGRRD